MRRSRAAIAASVMLASRLLIRPFSSNSHISLPYERYHWPAVIVPLVFEAHRDSVRAKGPECLLRPVIEFALPLAGHERHDCGAAAQQLGAVPPVGIVGVGQRQAF